MTAEIKTLSDRIKALKAEYDESLVWGVRWDAPGFPVGHIFDASRVWDDGEVVEGEYLNGTCVISESGLHNVTEFNFYIGTAYIVCGYHAGYGEDEGEVILSECEVMEVA